MDMPAVAQGPVVLSPYRILLFTPDFSPWIDLEQKLFSLGFSLQKETDSTKITPARIQDFDVLLLDCTQASFAFSDFESLLNCQLNDQARLEVWPIIDPADAADYLPFIQRKQIKAFVLQETAQEELLIYLERRYAIHFQKKTSETFADLQASLVKNPDTPHLKERIAEILTSEDYSYSGVIFHSLNYNEGALDIFTGYANGRLIPRLQNNLQHRRKLNTKFFHRVFSQAEADKEPIVIQDLEANSEYPFEHLVKKHNWKSLIALPLQIKRDIHAVMVVFTEFEHDFQRDTGHSERRMLQEFANLAATDHYNWRQFQKFVEIEESASKLAQFVSSRTEALSLISEDLLSISEAQGAAICYFEAMKRNFDPTRSHFRGSLGRGILDWNELSGKSPGELATLWKELFFFLINKRLGLRFLIPNLRADEIDSVNLGLFDDCEQAKIRPLLHKLGKKLYEDVGVRSMIVRCLRGRDQEPIGMVVFFYGYRHAYANSDSDHEYKKSLDVFLDLAAVTLDRAKASKRKEMEDKFFQDFIQETSPATIVQEATRDTWKMTLEHLIEITGATKAVLGFKDDWGINEFSLASDGSKPFDGNYLKLKIQGGGESLERSAFEDNISISIRSFEDYARWNIDDDEGMASRLIVPILKDDGSQPIGLFGLYCEKPFVFDQPDKEFVQKLVSILGIEIKRENVDTSGRVSIPDQTRFLVEATSKFAQITPIKDALHQMMDRFRAENEFDLINFHLFDPEWQRYDWDILSGNEVEDVLVLNQDVQEWLMDSSSSHPKIKRLDEDEQYAWLTGFFVERESLEDSFAVKILNGLRPIGLLMFHTRHAKQLSNREEENLIEFAEKVSKQVRKGDILPKLVEYLSSTLNLDNVSLHLYRQRDGKLATPIRSGVEISQEFLEERPYAAVYRALNHNENQEFVPDVSRSYVFNGDFVERLGFKSAGFVKVRDQDETLGVLFVNREVGHRWHSREQEIIQIFAQIAAVALQNRRRLREVKQSKKETDAILKASRRMMQNGFRTEEIAGIVLRQAVQISGAAFATMRHVNGNRLQDAEVWGLSKKEEKRWRSRHGEISLPVIKDQNKYMVGYFLQECLNNKEAKKQYIADISTETVYRNTSQKEVRSALLLAVRDPISQDPISILNLEHQELNGFRPKIINLLEDLVSQAATALHTSKRINSAQAMETLTLRGLFGSNWWHTVAQKTTAMKTDLAILNRQLNKGNPDPEVMRQLQKFKETLEKIETIPSRGILPESLELDPGPISIYDHVVNIVDEIALERKGIEIKYKLDRGSSKKVAIHASMLELALEKLITNAIQAMKGDGKITITDRSSDIFLIFDIADNGPGIPQEQKDQFLKRRIDKKNGSSGSGVGVMMAKYVFEKHGGNLILHKTSETGTTLRVLLPLWRETADSRKSQTT